LARWRLKRPNLRPKSVVSMSKLLQIIHFSLISTSQNPRWWILGFFQVISLPILVIVSARPAMLMSKFAFLFLAAILVGVPSTVYLWMDVDARKFKTVYQKAQKFFFRQCLTFTAIMLLTLGVIILAKLMHNDWVFLALLSSLVIATCVLAMMFAVLCEQDTIHSLALSASAWNKKFSLAATIAFVLIIVQALSFAFLHSFLKDFNPNIKFELLSGSATIWVLLLLLLFVVAICMAFLNSFLVHLFLDTIRRKKDPEAAEGELAKQARLEPNI